MDTTAKEKTKRDIEVESDAVARVKYLEGKISDLEKRIRRLLALHAVIAFVISLLVLNS